ncbi:MAG: hypothetical protein ACI4Q6_06495, partial [Huintestinicola sp.]
MRTNQKTAALAAMAVTLGIFTLSGCGASSSEADTTTAAVSSDTSAETAETASEAETVSENSVDEAAKNESMSEIETTTVEIKQELDLNDWKQSIVENDSSVASEEDILLILNEEDAEECAYIYIGMEAGDEVYCLSKINRDGDVETISSGIRGYDKIFLDEATPALMTVDSAYFGQPTTVVIIKNKMIYNVPVDTHVSYPEPMLMAAKSDDGTYSWCYVNHFSEESYQPIREGGDCVYDAEAYCFVPVTPSAPDPEKFRFYDAEVKSGYPEICDIESIKARQKNDVENFYNTEFFHDNDVELSSYSCLKPLDSIAPNYDTSEYKYIAEDVDYDGRDEYYLIIENEQINSDEYKQSYGNDINKDGQVLRKTITLYYIENNGETDFVYYMNGVSFGYHMFENGPEYQIVDYGDCKHLAQWYWFAYEGGGSGSEMLIDRNRFFDMPSGRISDEMSNENKIWV